MLWTAGAVPADGSAAGPGPGRSTDLRPEICAPPEVSAEPSLRFFFVTDVHSHQDFLDRFVEEANRERPDMVLDGGDFVHDGTWAEFVHAYRQRDRLHMPWRVAKGNHDARRRGPFPSQPPEIPELQTFTCQGVRFILLDNHDQRIGGELFDRLEETLRAHHGEPMVVSMHVAPFLVREPFLTRLRHFVPLEFAEPAMRDEDERQRFVTLMTRYDVLAVFTGHAHVHNDHTLGGVRYVAAGSAGGLIPGLGIQREYLDVRIEGDDVEVRRVPVLERTRNPAALLYRTFRFFAQVNSFNHAEQGWNYTPSGSVQWRLGARLTDDRDGGGDHAAMMGSASFEGVVGERGRISGFADLGFSLAPREAGGHFSAGYRLRPLGDFNRNAYVSGAGTLNAGVLRGSGTGGAGLQLEVGTEWEEITVGLRGDWATNQRAWSLVVGRRY